MNLGEDDELLGLFTQQCVSSESTEPLKRRIKELEEENKALFEKLDAQSTTIRRYRSVLRQAIEKKSNSPRPIQQSSPFPVPDTRVAVVAEIARTIPEVARTIPEVARAVPEIKDVSPQQAAAPVPALLPPPLVSTPARAVSADRPDRLVAYTMSGVLAAEPVAKKSRPNEDDSAALPQPQPCGGLITDKKIRCPSHERSSDGYAETLVGQTIWSAIVQFFNSTPNANLMDENMIIKQVGNLLLRDKTKSFLDSKMIHRYFSHPFTFTDDDQTMTVRSRIINGKPVWLVFIPEWLKAEWRAG